MLYPLRATRRWAEAHTVSSHHYLAGVHRADSHQGLGARQQSSVGAPSCSPRRVQLESIAAGGDPHASPGPLRKQAVVPQEKAASTAIPVPSRSPGLVLGQRLDPGLCITSTEAGASPKGTKNQFGPAATRGQVHTTTDCWESKSPRSSPGPLHQHCVGAASARSPVSGHPVLCCTVWLYPTLHPTTPAAPQQPRTHELLPDQATAIISEHHG